MVGMSSHCINQKHNHGHHPKMDCHFVEHVPVANFDMLRANVQSLLDDCESCLHRRSNGIHLLHSWVGISLNAIRDIQQRAGVMLRLLDGEEI
jgi:hypothetical protein